MNGSKDLKTIIYFKGVYDTLDLFTDHLIEAFESMGYGTFVYHTANEEVCKKMLLRLLDESQEFAVVTFNNLGYNLSFEQSEAAEDEEKKPEEHNIWNYFHIPYIDILMDHPFHYEKPLCNMPETAVILCTDRNHVKYIRRFFKNIHRTDFLPHAGVELGHKHKPLNDRNIDVLYAGALPIYTVAKMIPDLHSIPEVDGEHMMQSVLGELVQHPEQTTEQAIEAYVKSVRGDISDERLQEIIVKMRFLDSYATSFFREQAVRIKLSALRSEVEGRRVVMIDDSIVRGTTCRQITNLLREAGAKEVHIRVSAPPFIAPCYFGTDIPDRERLIACQHSLEEIREIAGADSLGYLPLEDLHQLAPKAACGFCDGCFTERYPVDLE